MGMITIMAIITKCMIYKMVVVASLVACLIALGLARVCFEFQVFFSIGSHEAISSDELDSSDGIATKSFRVNMKSDTFLWPTRRLGEKERVLFCCDITRLIRRSDQSNRR